MGVGLITAHSKYERLLLCVKSWLVESTCLNQLITGREAFQALQVIKHAKKNVTYYMSNCKNVPNVKMFVVVCFLFLFEGLGLGWGGSNQ